MKKIITLLLVCVAQSSAFATLSDLGSGAIFDSERNVTWTQDVRYAEVDLYPTQSLTSLYGKSVQNVDGSVHTVDATDIYQVVPAGAFRIGGTWWGATAWADSLNFAGASGWRLPTSSELTSILQSPQYTTFTHALWANSSYLFWTSSEIDGKSVKQVQYVPYGNPSHDGFTVGKEIDQASSGLFIQVAWAVHDGNISLVPEPSNWALLLGGIATLAARRLTRRSTRTPTLAMASPF
jgi:hypothetical protein